MRELGCSANCLLRIGRPRAAEKEAATHTQVEPDRSRLVDDDDPFAIRMLEHLFGVGVMRCAERVGPDPLEQGEVVRHGGIVVPATMDIEVLVLAEALEVEGLAVDEELRALDSHGADADREHVPVDDDVVVDEFCLEFVEVAAPGPPELWLRHAQNAVGTWRGGDLLALGVPETDADRRRAGIDHGHRIVDHPCPRLEVGHDGEIVDP